MASNTFWKSPRGQLLRPPILVTTGVLLIYLALLPPGISDIDGNSMFAVARSLALEGSFEVSCDLGFSGRNGNCYSPWYPLLSILAVPPVLAAGLLASGLSVPPIHIERIAALTVPALAGAAAAGLTFSISKEFTDKRAPRLLAAVALAFGTEMLVYSRTFFAETLVAFLLALAVLTFIRDGSARWLGYLAFGAAILAKPVVVIPAGLVGVYLLVRRRSFGPLLAVAAGLAVYLAYNWLRFADLLAFRGPERAEEILNLTSVPLGAATLLVSPGRGLFIFSPIAAVGAWMLWRHRDLEVARLSIVLFLGLLLIHAANPGRGDDWGDRYLVGSLPLLVAPVAAVRGRLARVAVFLAIIGFVIQIPATASFWQRYYREQDARGVEASQLVWSYERTPLVGAWGAMAREFEDASQTDVRQLVREAGKSTGSVGESQLLKTVALWWWMLPAVGVSRWVGIVISLVLVLVGAWMILHAGRAGP